MAFDVAGAIPAGSTIDGVTLTLTFDRFSGGSFAHSLHSLTQSWVEGTAGGTGTGGGQPTTATTDATWSHRSFNAASLWNALGGDFNPVTSAVQSVGATGSYVWSNPLLTTDVQLMLDDAANNFGWILIGNEAANGTAKRFHSRESGTTGSRPKLAITFTPPFTVTSSVPTQAQVDVTSSSDILVEFSDTVNSTTVSMVSFKVWGKQTGFKTGTFSFGSVTFNPSDDFKAGEEVHVMLNTNMQSDAGTALTPHVFELVVAAGGCSTFAFHSIQSMGNASSFDVALGDLDGDGDLDAYIANYGSGNTVWTNDGNGIFADSGQSLGAANSLNVALGDLDHDGDLDAFIGNDSGSNTVWTNSGSGVFFDSGQSLGSACSFGVELGDLDGDGDLDAFVANNGASNKVWVNDGLGAFTDSGQSLGSGNNRHIALGDVDNDGDLDAVVAVNGGGDTVWTNNGSGLFGLHQTVGSTNSFGVDLGDIDGDGDLDVAVSTVGGGSTNLIYTNNGSGLFTDTGQSIGTGNSCSVHFGDVDGDGDLDAFLLKNAPGSNEIYTNDNGVFTFSGVSFGNLDHRDLALGDIDNDGDLDIFLVHKDGDGNVALLNFHCGETNDYDGDQIPNNIEVENGLNPADNSDGATDADNDNQSNLDEHIAGTSITNGNERFEMTDHANPSNRTITINTVSNRQYTIYFTDGSFSNNLTWTPFANPAQGVYTETNGNTTHTFTDDEGTNTTLNAPADGMRHYRVDVESMPL